MISSMTGFGQAEFSWEGIVYTLELRSVNHRFFDFKLRCPREWSKLDFFIRNFFQKKIQRGSIDFRIEKKHDPTVEEVDFQVDQEKAKQVFNILEKTRSNLKIEEPVSLRLILQQSDVTLSRLSLLTEDQTFLKNFEKSILQVLSEFQNSRKKEGKELTKNLEELKNHIVEKIKKIEMRKPEIEVLQKNKIKEKVEKVFESYPLSLSDSQALMESKISQELAFFVDRSDVTEELTRLHTHLKNLSDILQKGGLVGKKLEFLLQEIHREITTLGNKSQDLEISEHMLDCKVTVEKMKEQVLNLE